MTLAGRIKDSFVAGLLLVAPLVVTVFVLKVLAGWAVQFVDPVVQGTRLTQYTADDTLVAQLLAAALIVATITLLGFLVQRPSVRHVFGRFGRVVTFIPLVNVVYTSVRQVASSLVDRDSRFESVVLVEYPREGVYAIGLVTAESPPAAERTAGEAVYNVFLPNSPNPTAGRLVLVPESQVHETGMSVREGMRLLVTTGMGADGTGTAGERPTAPSMVRTSE